MWAARHHPLAENVTFTLILLQGTGSHNDATTSGQATSAAGVNIPAVPPLPLMVPKNPVEQAGLVLGAKQATAQQLINAALHVGDARAAVWLVYLGGWSSLLLATIRCLVVMGKVRVVALASNRLVTGQMQHCRLGQSAAPH
jgi:hypothetical protein